MKKKYPNIPVCCTPRTCSLIILGLLFLPFIRIREDSFCIPMMTKRLKEIKAKEAEKTKSLLVRIILFAAYDLY